jgi:sialidase-1
MNTNGEVMSERWILDNPDEMNCLRRELGTERYVLISDDNGIYWNRSKEYKYPELGPTYTNCIKLKYGKNKGRIILPSRITGKTNNKPWFGSEIASEWHNLIFYSDDAGRTWNKGGMAQAYTGEGTCVELSNGAVYINNRNHGETMGQRNHAISYDGGISFSEFGEDIGLIEPVCHASMIRYSEPNSGNIILFANPAIRAQNNRWCEREKMTIRASFDDCKTWPISKLIDRGKCGYSAIVVCKDETILCAYERGQKTSREEVVVARFNWAWLIRKD